MKFAINYLPRLQWDRRALTETNNREVTRGQIWKIRWLSDDSRLPTNPVFFDEFLHVDVRLTTTVIKESDHHLDFRPNWTNFVVARFLDSFAVIFINSRLVSSNNGFDEYRALSQLSISFVTPIQCRFSKRFRSFGISPAQTSFIPKTLPKLC